MSDRIPPSTGGGIDIPVTGPDGGRAVPTADRGRRPLPGESRATVAVLGGGIGGLSAAQELAERGFDVTVYEANDRFGGKARSMPGPQRGLGPALPAEHGFRFFPGFYSHLTDTMERIPFPGSGSGPDPEGEALAATDGGTAVRSGSGQAGAGATSGNARPAQSVADNLVACPSMLQATLDDVREISVETPESVDDWVEVLASIFGGRDVPPDESAYFINRLLHLLTSCRARRENELETTTWWEFIDAESMSDSYRTYLGYGLTQALVAMRPQVSSARTIGRIYVQLFRSRLDSDTDADRVLNGPSNAAWIDPWVRYLEALGVDLRPGAPVERIHADGRRVTGVTVDETERRADQYVAALPVEVMRRLTTPELTAAAPALEGLAELETAWMNGLQFYLSEPLPIAEGHSVFYDSPWALTAVSQRQFWSPEVFDLSACDGDDDVAEVLSVIVSEWDEPGILFDKPARQCRADELRREVWAQLAAHLDGSDARLREEAVVDWFIDPELHFEETDDGVRVRNDAPLLINTVGSLEHRPPAATAASNLTLAADYVRTETDLASMEAANEAARRATNAVLEREGVEAEPCELWEFREPAVFRPLRRADRSRYRLGIPHPGESARPVWRAYRGLREASGSLERLGGLLD